MKIARNHKIDPSNVRPWNTRQRKVCAPCLWASGKSGVWRDTEQIQLLVHVSFLVCCPQESLKAQLAPKAQEATPSSVLERLSQMQIVDGMERAGAILPYDHDPKGWTAMQNDLVSNRSFKIRHLSDFVLKYIF